MYYVSVETYAWKDRDTISAASHSQAAVRGIARAYRKNPKIARCHVYTSNVMDGTRERWLYDGWTLKKTTDKEQVAWR